MGGKFRAAGCWWLAALWLSGCSDISDLASTEQQLIVRVVQAYLNVLRAQDRLDTTMAEEAAVKRQLEQV